MSKLKLIYDDNASWEKDYIKELFIHCNYDIISLNNLKIEDELINNNILVFSSNVYTFQQIKNLSLIIKPLIIVHLSDEAGNRPEYTDLASCTKLLLHQYHFNHYPYNNYNNIIQIPLGYMTNMFNNENRLNFKLKPLLERKYKWSFIGNIKQDRAEIIYKFSNKFNENFTGNNISPQRMFEIYNDSVFIPNGKGNCVIDCFRIYEAIFSGSIPIIVCEEDEFNERFHFNNDIPPFIFEKTWDDAVNKCDYLLNNIEELENIKQTNYEWLKNKIESIQKNISSVLIISSTQSI